MLTAGGRSLEDLRTLKNDAALAQLLKMEMLPSTDAMGDWLRRTGAGTGMTGLDRIKQRTVATRLRQMSISRHTLDCDASRIVAEKYAAEITCKGEQGYMPMIGHLAEVGNSTRHIATAGMHSTSICKTCTFGRCANLRSDSRQLGIPANSFPTLKILKKSLAVTRLQFQSRFLGAVKVT